MSLRSMALIFALGVALPRQEPPPRSMPSCTGCVPRIPGRESSP
jgi:hypothetical protein